MTKHPLWDIAIVLAGVGVLFYLTIQRQPTAAPAVAEGGPSPWEQDWSNGGLPTSGMPYWGANAPIASAGDIYVNVNPDYLAAVGKEYIPLFGFVAVGNPEAILP